MALPPDPLDGLPEPLALGLRELLAAARAALDGDLLSVVLFGSAAEARLRPVSDVNLMFVLERCDPARVEALGPSLRLAHAVLRVEPLLILHTELPAAVEQFAVKFADMHQRHRVLYGPDPLDHLPTRAAAVARLRQVLLNQVLRTRAGFALAGGAEPALAALLAQGAGPLRAAAALLLALQGRPAPDPRSALEQVAAELAGAPAVSALETLSVVRAGDAVGAAACAAALLALQELAQAMAARVAALE